MIKSACLLLASALTFPMCSVAEDTASEADLLFGGCGGVYFLADPGELVVEVFKRNTSRPGRHTELRAILVGPDRQWGEETAIPDSGTGPAPAPLQRAKLSTQVERKGVYALNSPLFSSMPHSNT